MKNTRALNPKNERVKREYLHFLKHAKGQNEQSLDAVIKAISRFESFHRYKDFKDFHHAQAVAFKQSLVTQVSKVTGEKLSLGTARASLGQLKSFFQWVCGRPGYKSGFQFSDTEYFNLSEKENRIATARRNRSFPTLEQMQKVLASMPDASVIERRNRALIAFTMITGARDGAVASLKLKHIDLEKGLVFQDAREVNTKFSKTFPTYFAPLGGGTLQLVTDWILYLRKDCLWGNDDPVFPATEIVVGETRRFEVEGVKRAHWSNASPIRKIFRNAFEIAGLPYFNPHSLRNMLVQLGEKSCRTPEEFKAWSQNLGHEKVMTTFFSYGVVDERRQGEIIQGLSQKPTVANLELSDFAKAFFNEAASRGFPLTQGSRVP